MERIAIQQTTKQMNIFAKERRVGHEKAEAMAAGRGVGVGGGGRWVTEPQTTEDPVDCVVVKKAAWEKVEC